jgi:hypothetical protein
MFNRISRTQAELVMTEAFKNAVNTYVTGDTEQIHQEGRVMSIEIMALRFGFRELYASIQEWKLSKQVAARIKAANERRER